MTDRYDVTVKVVSQKGTCGAKHKVGDQWTITDKTPEGICLSAYDVIYPSIHLTLANKHRSVNWITYVVSPVRY
jgi:uncharacterized repeat protein (TIGR04076 family)